MEDKCQPQRDPSPTPSPSHRRAPSSPGLLSKFPFIRYGADHPTQVSEDDDQRHDDPQNDTSQPASARSFTATGQQHKTRRRRGSLRKVALLGRGAQRDRGDSRGFGGESAETSALQQSDSRYRDSGVVMAESDALGLHEPDLTPRATHDPRISQISLVASNTSSAGAPGLNDRVSELPSAYNSTTDEDDILHIPHGSTANRAGLSISSGSESYFGNRGSAHRQRPFQQTKSPLSYSGLSKTSLPPPDSDWDYAETEWWGWVVLGVTWFVFVIGMGSCLNVWSWAWDIGKTPYAPPELEDDPTLPIVGYYPALIILTGVMAWVWVVVAWVGMKYFRHAKISGD